MNTDEKLYYVTGKDSRGDKRTVKTYARTPAEARSNASWVLWTPGVVRRG
jgi:hypothetical protein